jgi:hypothetical protein
MRRIILATAGVLALLAFGWFVWPTRFTYRVTMLRLNSSTTLREDRFTGRQWIAVGGEWVEWGE